MKRMKITHLLISLACVVSLAISQEEPYIELLQSVEAFNAPIYQGSFSAKGNAFAFVTNSNALKTFDATTLREKVSFPAQPSRITALSLSKSGQMLAIGMQNAKVAILNTSSMATTTSFSPNRGGISVLAFQDESWIFSAGADKVVIISDAISGSKLAEFPEVPENITTLSIHPSSKFFAVGTSVGTVEISSVSQMNTLKVLTDSKENICALAYDKDGKYLAAGTLSGGIYLWDSQTYSLKCKWNDQKSTIWSVTFDPQSRWLITTSADSTLRMYSLEKQSPVKTVKLNDGYGTYTCFLNDETLITATSKGTLKRWKVLPAPPDTTNPVLAIAQPANSSVQTPLNFFGDEFTISGYAYDDSEVKEVIVNGWPANLTAPTTVDVSKVPAGMKTKHFDFKVKLDSVGLNPFELVVRDKVDHVASKRCYINRLSNDQAVEILSPANNAETDLISIPIKFKAWFDIASYSISVNLMDIISNQEPGFNVVNNEIMETIPLLVGYNQIQFTVISKSGDKFIKTLGASRKANIAIADPTLAGATKKERIAGSGPQHWAVVVGVSQYLNGGVPSLKYADKDAESFANFLRRPEGGGYDNDHMRVLLNKDATLSNIKDGLINFLSQAIDMDLVVIYFAGHGAPEPARPQNMYLLTYDTDPTALGTTAFPMWDIQTVLARYINAKRVIVFTDACHSGGISVNFATRGLGVTENNMVNQYLADLSRSKEGVVVFTASAAGEFSQEYPEFEHGVFTYYLLEGIGGKADYNNDYTITINELMQYVEEQVKRKTRGAQNPTRSQTEYDKDMTISIVPH